MSSEVSAETHIFVGVFRPEINALIKEINARADEWYIKRLANDPTVGGTSPARCPICDEPVMADQIRSQKVVVKECWDAGHFDTPVYKTIEEVIRLQRPPEVVKPAPEPRARSRSTMWPEIDEPNPK